MSRPRTPTAILETRGSFVKHPERKAARKDEPVPSAPLGDPPRGLDRFEKLVWRELEEQLLPNVAGNSDRLAFRKLVCLEAKSRKGQTKASEEMLILSYITKFGLTPADRTKVKTAPRGKAKDDALGDFLGDDGPIN